MKKYSLIFILVGTLLVAAIRAVIRIDKGLYCIVHKKIKYSQSLKARVVFFSTATALVSCGQKNRQEKWRHVEIYPKDRSKAITIITKDKKRFIMDGKHETVPDNGYLLLDI